MENKQGKWKPYNVKSILGNVELVFKTGDITKLNQPAYNFIMLMSGFIAHYNLAGFQEAYHNVEDLRKQLDDNSILNDADRDETDGDFERWYGKAYNQSKAEIKRGLVALARKYKDKLQSELRQKTITKIEDLIKQAVEAKRDPDPTSAEKFLRQIGLL